MLNRRVFLKSSLVCSAGAALQGFQSSGPAVADSVAVFRGQSPYRITKEVMSVLGGMERFVSRQSVVMIKPNIAFAQAPKMASTTNPEVVKAIVEMAFEAGAKRVLVMDNPIGSYKPAYERSGIGAVVAETGAEMVPPDFSRLVPHDMKGGFLKGLKIFRDCIEVDTFINVPILKSHSMTRLSLGMKNLLGLVQNREFFHSDSGKRIAELAWGFAPHLNIMDAYRVMTSGGPQSGPTTEVKMVMASANVLQLDAVAAAAIGVRPEHVPYLPAGRMKGMGEIDVKKIDIKSYELADG